MPVVPGKIFFLIWSRNTGFCINPDGSQIMGANNKPVSSLLLKSQIGKPMMMKNQTGTWSNEIVKCYYTPNVVEDNMISQKITQGKPLTTSNVSNGSNMLSSKNMPSELVRQGAVGAYKPQQLASNVMHTIQEEPYTPESARYSEHYQSLRNSENPTPSTFTAYNSGHPGPRSQSHKSPLVLNSTANTTGPTTPHKYQSTKTYSSTPTGGQHTISYTSHGNTQVIFSLLTKSHTGTHTKWNKGSPTATRSRRSSNTLRVQLGI